MKPVKVKDLITALLQENQEANVFIGFSEDYDILRKPAVSRRGNKIFKRDEEGYKTSGQPYSKGCAMYEMVEDEAQLKEPWIVILS